MEYNTQRSGLILKEHGRNIQKLVSHIKTIEDKEKRNEFARTLVDLMRRIDPNTKDYPEYQQKLWDDLYIMGDFNIDLDSPYPVPEKYLDKKPQKVAYQNNRIRYKHYGRNIELFIRKAIETEDPEMKKTAIIHIGRLMRVFYHKYNNEIMGDQQILDNIKELSKGQLTIDPEEVQKDKLFEVNLKDKPSFSQSRDRDSRGKKGGGRHSRGSNQKGSNRGSSNNRSGGRSRRRN